MICTESLSFEIQITIIAIDSIEISMQLLNNYWRMNRIIKTSESFAISLQVKPIISDIT